MVLPVGVGGAGASLGGGGAALVGGGGNSLAEGVF